MSNWYPEQPQNPHTTVSGSSTPADPYYYPPSVPQPPVGQQPGYGYAPMAAPVMYGIDPMTGLPFSDKSKVAAGLLSIFLGGLGVGRFYTGHWGIGLTQLLLSVLLFWTGIVPVAVGIWALVDGIIMLTGNVRDANGLPLRN